MRNGQPYAIGLDIIDLMDALKIQKAIFAGFDWGARTADVMACSGRNARKALVSVSGYLISSPAANQVPVPPEPAFLFWYQYYFATPRRQSRLCQIPATSSINSSGTMASPKWNFDDATYDRTAAAFNNPDHVDIVIHDYRLRLGLADGERKYDDLEKRLAAASSHHRARHHHGRRLQRCARIRPRRRIAERFTGKYDYRLLTGGIGHNLPQEAPQAFAQAVIDVDGF